MPETSLINPGVHVMPMPCYLSIEGQNQGKIQGSSTVTGHEGMILVQAVEHLIDIPKNPQTGLPASVFIRA
jgi:type VI secretion system secreted protein Hcp